jgi:Arc/MetJ family transcription regulator
MPDLRSHNPLCNVLCRYMATNLQIDDRLLAKAQRVGGHRTKREAVNEALAEYVRRREQLKILKLAGTIDYHPDYDYKKQRKRK